FPSRSKETPHEHEIEDRHCGSVLHDRHGPGNNTRVMTARDDNLRRPHRPQVDGSLRLRDGRGRLDRNAERDGHAVRAAAEDAADAIAVFPGRLDFLDHAVRRLEVGTPDRAEFDVRRNLLRSDRLRGDPTDLGRMRVEPNAFLFQHLTSNRAGDDQWSCHPARELAAPTEIALPSIFHRSREVSMPGTRDPRDVGIGFRLHVLVADERDDRVARTAPVRDAFREFYTIRLLTLGRDKALSRSTAVELRLDDGLVNSRPGAQALDRAA